MIVVFLYGPAASGKHTIGSLVSERTGLPLFHNHLTVDLAKTLFEFGSDPFVRLRATIWRESFAAAVAARRSFIFTFHPEATVDPALIDELLASVTSAGGTVCTVELRCSREAILERIDNVSRRRFGKLTDRTLYEEIERQGGFDYPPLPAAGVTIDTEVTPADEAADTIAETVAQLARSGPRGSASPDP